MDDADIFQELSEVVDKLLDEGVRPHSIRNALRTLLENLKGS